VRVDAKVPAGWTVTATPGAIPLTPASTATLTTLHVAVPADAVSGTYAVPVTARATDGTTARSTVNVIVFGKWPTGTTVSASSEHAPNTVDGQVRTYVATNAVDVNLATFWNDDTDGQYPDTLTVTTPAAVTLHGVGLASHVDGAPTDFTVQTWDGTQWVTQAAVSANTSVYRWIPFAAPVSTGQVRIVVTGARNSFTRIAEFTP
jgi:alpha-L-rhamnosidase